MSYEIHYQRFHNRVSVFFFSAHMIEVLFGQNAEPAPQTHDVIILSEIIVMPG
jgi:hypothetical protein